MLMPMELIGAAQPEASRADMENRADRVGEVQPKASRADMGSQNENGKER